MSDAPAIVRVLRDGVPTWGRLDGDMVVLSDGGVLQQAEAHFLAPVQPTKMLATHLSYQSRVTEYAMARPPAEPAWFLKPPTALSGPPGDPPARGRTLPQLRGELAVVVGRRMKGVSEADALDHVAGYAPANDVGLHDFRHADRGAMVRVKGQDGFLPIGPAITHASAFDPTSFTIRTYLNGEQVQQGGSDDLMFPVAYQLAGRNAVCDPAERKAHTSVPMFWSDQYEVKIQAVGLPALAERVHMAEAAPEGDRFVAIGERDGTVVAAYGWAAARRLPFYRKQVAEGARAGDVLAAVAADPKAFGSAVTV